MIRSLRIFISSPGDVGEERSIVRKTISRLGASLSEKCALLPVDWTDRSARTPYLATLTPQEAIDRGLPTPARCSIVVVILWSRMGTPLDPARYHKEDGTPYLSGTEYEYENAIARAQREERPRVLVFRRKKAPMLDLDDPERDEKARQWDLVKKFFARFQKADGTWTGSYESYQTPAEFAGLLEGVLEREVEGILAAEPDAEEREAMAQPHWVGSPFPGLRSFRLEDAPIFFGRERETDHVLALLAAPGCRFVAVAGVSGSGKSSLVRAGVLSRLMDNAVEGSKDWRSVAFTPGGASGDPFLALAEALTQANLSPPDSKTADIARDLRADAKSLARVASAALEGAPDWAELLILVDQLEELFSMVAPADCELFIERIAEMANCPRLRILATFRADFYPRCVEIPRLAQLMRGAYPLAPPESIALYEMITRPAAYAGLEFEDGLARQILGDTGSSPGALALMAYLLDELYRGSIKLPERKLTFAAYEALGKVQGAIAHRAEECFAALDKPSQDAFPAVFSELVHVDDRGVVSRQRAALAGFAGNPPAQRLIEALIANRLLVTGEPAATVEIAHEALFQGWKRLADWIDSTRDDRRLLAQMRLAAQEWEARGRAPAYVWTHDRSAEMLRMLGALKPSLNEVERAFARPESEHLLAELADPKVDHPRRAQIGDRLEELGDPRRGVGLGADGWPDLAWQRVEAASGYDDFVDVAIEGSVASVRVRSFSIALYPISYRQYRAFLEAEDGFHNSQWWEGLEASYVHRAEPGAQVRRSLNHPAENVSWYDAVAACRWMSARLGCTVRLPEEAEWQLAAAGDAYGEAYPWGAGWLSHCANTWASNLSRTIASGMYPAGVARCGALDLSGNIYEWTASPGFGADQRIARGGSWYHTPADARTTARASFYAHERLSYCGFRVVCAAPLNRAINA
jgi:hypothetical protein